MVQGIAHLGNDLVVTSGCKTNIMLWNVADGQKVDELIVNFDGEVYAVAKLDDSKFVALTDDSLIVVSHFNGNMKLETTLKLEIGFDGNSDVAVLSGLIVAVYFGTVKVFDAKNLQLLATWKHNFALFRVSIEENYFVVLSLSGNAYFYSKIATYDLKFSAVPDDGFNSAAMISDDIICGVTEHGCLNFVSRSSELYLARLKICD